MSQLLGQKRDFFSHINTRTLLIILWVLLTLFNINKAFHMDDSFHLEAAAHLRNHPLTPMSGAINWASNPEPMFEHNQPPLYFYCLALVTSVFGESEIALHLFQSIFSFFILYFFVKIVDLVGLKNKNILLILFAFCPGLIVNQNIMTDVPILSLIMGVCYFLLKAKRNNPFKNYLIASLLLSAGLLIKYSLLPIFVVILISIVLNRAYKSLFVLLIPMLVLVLWSYWNYIEYGGVHILNRTSGVNEFYEETINILVCLGAISPFSFLFLADLLIPKFKKSVFMIYGMIALSVFIPIFYYFSDINVESVMAYTYVFFSFGVIVVLCFLAKVITGLREGLKLFLASDQVVFALFFAGLGGFFLLFAPFIATRHMLLMIPFVFFIGVIEIERLPNKLVLIITSFSIVYGTLLGVSDWKYADYYRNMAQKVDIPNDGKVWSAGHWGWQHYIKNKNVSEFRSDSMEVQHGDYYVCPGNVSRQYNMGDFLLVEVDKIWEGSDATTFLSGSNFAGMYNTFPVRPPWVFSKAPIDTIYVYKIDKGVPYLIKKIRSSKEWLKQVEEKAVERGVSLDSMLILDAEWVLSHQE